MSATPGGTRGASGIDDVTLRRCETRAEFQECVAIQEEAWGTEFSEIVPATILQVSQQIGGVTAGAFDAAGRMLGFVFGLTGLQHGRPVHWSDLLAVRAEAQSRGLGTRLKRYQRELLRPLGVETMYWTYDPLVARNAYLNLVRLGARAVEYVPDMYGTDTGSELHAGMGTDRFVVAWRVADDAGMETRSEGGESGGVAPGARGAGAPVVNAPDADGVPRLGELPEGPAVRVAVPNDIQAVKARSLRTAQAWRESTRRAFTWYLARGYVVAGFERGAEERGGHYLLTHVEHGGER